MTGSAGISYESVGATSSGLLDRAKAHEEAAWRRLVRLYGPLVDMWIGRAGLQRADAMDVFQNVFYTVARAIGDFRNDQPGATFRGWLRTITRSKIIDHHRRQGKSPGGVGGSDAVREFLQIPDKDEAETGTSEATAIRHLQFRALEMIRAEFEERTWQMFWRVAIEARTTNAVAEDFGVTPAAVRMAKSRVLRRFREELGGLEE